MADLSGPWWDWAARLRRIMAEREAARAGKELRHQRRLAELARRKREG